MDFGSLVYLSKGLLSVELALPKLDADGPSLEKEECRSLPPDLEGRWDFELYDKPSIDL
jgi:hypothetical protein